jgi:hypothetical protein
LAKSREDKIREGDEMNENLPRGNKGIFGKEGEKDGVYPGALQNKGRYF